MMECWIWRLVGDFSSPSWSWDTGSDLVDTFENFTVSANGVFTLKNKPIFSIDLFFNTEKFNKSG